MKDSTPAPGRSALVWLTATMTAALLVAGAAPDLDAAAGAVADGALAEQPFDRLVVWFCAAALTACVGWLWLVTTLVVGEAACGIGPRTRGVPGWLRHVVLVACGVAVLATAAPATATPGSIHLDRDGRDTDVIVQGLPLPDRATGGAHLPPPDERVSVVAQGHEVLPGESLWSIAETALGAAPDDGDVAAYWREIYAANRHVVGPDPDLIQPGQLLRLPPR